MSRIKDSTGSVIIATLILTLVLAALVGVYLSTVVQEEELSYRSRMAFQAVNIAESGIDFAIYSFIEDDWDGWDAGSNGYYRSDFSAITNPPAPDSTILNGFNGLGTNENYSVKVYAQKGDPGATDPDDLPAVLAEGTITLNNGITVSRQIMVRLQYGASDDPKRGGFWGNGMLAKEKVTFNGSSVADSFNSANGGGSTIQQIYDSQAINYNLDGDIQVASGNTSVASLSVSVADLSIGNSFVYGSVATGALEEDENTDPQDLVGPNGSIYDEETEADDPTFDGNIDTATLTYDFFADLPEVTIPEVNGTPYTSFGTGDYDPDGDGPEPALTGVGLLADDDTTDTAFTEYRLSGNLDIKDTVIVTGHVMLVVDGNLKIFGNSDAMIQLATNAKLDIFVTGDVTISGGGILNSGDPPNLRLFNTGVAAKKSNSITLGGNAAFSGAVYAPGCDLVINGGGTEGAFYGSAVANTITINGDVALHYDEALKNQPDPYKDPDDERFTPEVHSWVELTDASEIRNMGTILDDGI